MKELLLYYLTWCKIGLLTFGGGYAILPMIDKEIVQKRHWVENDEVMDYFAISQSLPGIIAVNTAVFIGYKKAGVKGAVASALGVISPSIVLITLVATLLSGFQEIPAVSHALSGIRIGVCVLMATTIVQLGKNAVRSVAGAVICLAAFALSYFARLNIALLVVLSAVSGIVISAVSEKRRAKAGTK